MARPDRIESATPDDQEVVDRLVAFAMEAYRRRAQKVPAPALVAVGAMVMLVVAGLLVARDISVLRAIGFAGVLAFGYAVLLRRVLEVDDLPENGAKARGKRRSGEWRDSE